MDVLNEVKAIVKQAIIEAVTAAGIVDAAQIPEIILEVPKEKTHGDFATNIAMQLTRIAKQNPRQIAEQIIANLQKDKANIAEAEIAGPGFINFKMNKVYLYPVIENVQKLGDRYGATNVGQGLKVQVEFVSANPTGSLHLGHARGAAVGDVLCNVLDLAGYDVSREYYINDAGNQVINLAKSIEARYLQALGQEAEMPEDGYFGEDIKGFAADLLRKKGIVFLACQKKSVVLISVPMDLKKNSTKSNATWAALVFISTIGSPRRRFMKITSFLPFSKSCGIMDTSMKKKAQLG